MPHMPFEYYFYAELVGDPARAESEALLRELDRTCRTGTHVRSVYKMSEAFQHAI